MCQCVNVEFGSYDNQVMLNAPSWSSYEFICVDKCLEEEVRRLWVLGIKTTGCCCGHNKLDSYIGVWDEDIPKMKEIGYSVAYNPCRPTDQDSFISKSIEFTF